MRFDGLPEKKNGGVYFLPFVFILGNKAPQKVNVASKPGWASGATAKKAR
jgi:hypothetical protein